MAAEKWVQVGRMGSVAKTVVLENGTTVADTIAKAGFEIGANEAIKVNGTVVKPTSTLKDKDRVTLVPAMKGAN
jgi:sulfur carrier protein ThiS